MRPNVPALDPKAHLGIFRVLEPKGVLPQQAQRLDPELPLRAEEILIDVSSLNVDSASFHQFYEANGKNAEKTGEAIL
ncbi:MAG: L-erythro-3,5-diaminohexanoate dehydrogenase, partial [Bdellovibrionota bacterium]